MKKSTRTSNSIKNALFSSGTQIVNLLVSYILRFVFVKTLSSDYLGVSGLFTNILTVFSLAELGIGSAIVYSMYKPIAENNIDKIKAYMNFYKIAYRIIALLVSLIGLLILPNLGFFIKEVVNVSNLKLIYILFLIDSVFSYLCVYKISILNATQKNYIYNMYQTIFKFISAIFMCIALILTKNYIVYLIIQVVFKIIVNLIVSLKTDKIYPYLKNTRGYKLKKEEKKDISKNVVGLFFNQIGNVIINGTDNIIISKYVSLTAVGLYSNYTMIINAVSNFIGQIFNSIISSVGNYGVKENRKKTFYLFNKIHFINFIIVSFCMVELFSCIDTFIELSFGKEYVMDTIVVIIVLINFYMLTTKNVVGTFKYALGIFWDDKYSTVVRSIINLIVSVILTIKIGIIGVFLGTLISDFLTTFWFQPYILYKKGFNMKVIYYFKDYLKYSLITLFEVLIVTIIRKYILLINHLFISFILEIIVGIIVFVTITFILFRNNAYLLDFINAIKFKFKRRD